MKILGVVLIVLLAVGAIKLFFALMMPAFSMRVLIARLGKTLYPLRAFNADRVPAAGGALLLTNHATILDALVIQAASPRAIRFVAGADILSTPWLRRLASGMGLITYDPDGDEAEIDRAVTAIRDALKAGALVGMTLEGPFKADGGRHAFQRDFDALLGDVEAPVVPVHVDRLLGITYLVNGDRFRWRKPKSLPYRVQVNFGEPIPRDSALGDVRRTVQRLGTESYMRRPPRYKLLHHGFIRCARRNLFKMAMADGTTGELSYFKALVGSIVFARKLKERLDDQPMVGVLVPPSIGGALTNIALQMMGRTPVNLNYTASNEAIASCARQCNITQVLTSRKVLERLPIKIPGETVFLEDIRETVTGKDRLRAMVWALFAPIGAIERSLDAPPRDGEDIATIIFSSGSEGDPKGVVLSHRNIQTNIESAVEVFPHHSQTCLVGFLPFFHSFGYMGTLWLPLNNGFRAIYHPNPLEPKIVGGLIEKYRGTIMIATSTFLQGFIRRCTPNQLASLELLICGAEKLSPRVRTAFKEKFGLEPLEGYGTTECAPAVSSNIPDYPSPGYYLKGTRHGTIGRPFPGQSVRIINPDTGDDLPDGESGLLLVKGPNIMQGYLDQPEKTAAVLKDGWYETGDIAAIDEDGFITITDRLARFSKIAGEMVPHTKVEETLHGLIDLTEQAMAIASVPDHQKGERLVVLHTLDEEQLEALIEKLEKSDLPNLWRPRANAFYRIDEIPVLGTGKMDLKAVKQMAAKFDLGE